MELVEKISAAKVIAIIRGDYTPDALRVLAQTLHDAGVTCLEITMNSPGALDGIKMLASEMGETLLIGAGTVTDPAQVGQVADAGGRFVVAPETYEPVIKMALGLGLEPIPGALTPTEIMTAHRAGARLVKLFPASLGGIDYLKTIRAPLNHIQFVATGGIEIDQAAEYLKAGAVAVGMGSALVPGRFTPDAESVALLLSRGQRLMHALSRSELSYLA
jgi:2-dehydro-3-deoxyphosphogluconate aldolase / (4S)-4-hydroxy-2-oxoglutarate aldolase